MIYAVVVPDGLYVHEAEDGDKLGSSKIIKLGVRVNPLTVDEQRNFEQGKSITTNALRTLKRCMRRNLQRYKLRRENLIEVLRSMALFQMQAYFPNRVITRLLKLTVYVQRLLLLKYHWKNLLVFC